MTIGKLNDTTVRLLTSTQVITSLQSVVKELVENALDAGSQSIDVKLIDNGMTLIEVCDNGTGITDEDARAMAMANHTSKISCFQDLEKLDTYGFRGEALSSMCQVADVSVVTKQEVDDFARHYTFGRQGNVENLEKCAGCTGTVVQVKQLFKYVPVRKQIFNDSKKITQDIKQVEKIIKSFGIGQSAVRFSLKVNNKLVFVKPATKSIKDSLCQVLGAQIASNLEVLEDGTSEVGNVQLIVPKRDAEDLSHIYQSGSQFVFVNKRPIGYKDLETVIADKIGEYFGNKVPQRKKPVYCLSIDVNPKELDVNLEANKTIVFLKNLDQTKQLLSDTLTKYYGLNVVGHVEVTNDSTLLCDVTSGYEPDDDKENSQEVQQQKRRKIQENAPNENLMSNYTPALATDNLLSGIPAPLLSDSDSNDSFPERRSSKLQVSVGGPSALLSITQRNEASVDVAQRNVTEDVEMSRANADIGQCTFVHNNPTSRGETDAITSVLAGKVTREQWSRGQVPGLPCPTMVAVGGAPSKSKSPAQKFGPKGFTLFSDEFKAKLLKKHPDLSPVMIAAKLSTSWKELTPEEKAYYRGTENSFESPRANSLVNKTTTSKRSRDPLKEAKDNLKLKSVLQYVQHPKAKPQLKINLEDKHHDNMPTSLENVKKKFSRVEQQNYPAYVSSELSVIGKTEDPNLWLFQEGQKISAVFIPNFLDKFNLGFMLNAKEVDADILEKFLKQGILEADNATHCFYNL